MNSKAWKLALCGAALTFALTACGSDDGDYVPEPTAAEQTTYNTYVLAHPGQECVMTWGAGLYVNNCYPMGTVIPYSYHVYYPRTGYCGCWSTAPRPANYTTVYVKRSSYQPGRTTNVTINKTTNVAVNNNKPAGSAPKPAAPAPRPAAPAPARPASGGKR